MKTSSLQSKRRGHYYDSIRETNGQVYPLKKTMFRNISNIAAGLKWTEFVLVWAVFGTPLLNFFSRHSTFKLDFKLVNIRTRVFAQTSVLLTELKSFESRDSWPTTDVFFFFQKNLYPRNILFRWGDSADYASWVKTDQGIYNWTIDRRLNLKLKSDCEKRSIIMALRSRHRWQSSSCNRDFITYRH